MNTIKQVFETNYKNKKGCLIGYITAGDPTPNITPKIADALIRGGVDILELGLPFSDPIADGPTIQAASIRALNAGTTPMKVLEIAKKIKSKHVNVPIVIMTYYNPIFRIGLDNFLSTAKTHGVNGFIVPDLPIEEAAEFKKTTNNYDLDTIFLAAPSTSEERLNKIVNASSGFLYLVSHFGVTGVKSSIENSTLQLIQRVKPITDSKIPLAVGFGISKPEHVQRIIKAGADAAIVGSAFINIIQNNTNNTDMLNELEATAKTLKTAIILERP
ncbi:MAG: tryptophan synthase subunit alpha [Candidatus Bathyarchaeota archaeon]|uniref:tryptophan synthase subunit alpha n=1 Tax=Candidatus Bathycorpusculum sp. TaxID=2994959 RepID=UPI00281B65B4|nr:tryptophan synthase subunit alpha [Candidatus Termiticorpusculum sp.]MCL2257068.1 tryptophan synthase subunit alpha [Candidatus Termiticorpusculum sp.]MCL2292776.1 tryptophan synthase subunit alpha [Candidatus Termiticorpusculum sp.]